MKIKSTISFLLFFSFFIGIKAQDNSIKTSFTLEEAIAFALENAVSIENAKLGEQSAKARIGETRAAGLPQINGNVQLSHSDPLQRMFFSMSDDNPILGGQGGMGDLPDGAVIAYPNFFQLPSSGDAHLSINQLLFNGSYFVGLQAAKTYKELASKSTEQSEIQTVEQVTKAYYTVLINKERLELFNANIARVDSLLKNTKALYENGFAENIDVARIQVTMNNLQIEKENFSNLIELSKGLLKFQMNYPMDQEIDLESDLMSLELEDNNLELLSSTPEYSKRIEYSLLETQQRLLELDLKNQKMGYLPTLSAFGQYGYFTQSPDIGGLFKTNTDGIPEGSPVGPDKWYGYGMFGVSLQIPIFDGLSKSYKVQQARIELEKTKNQFENLESSIELQVNQSKITLKNSLKTLEAQEENVDLAEEVARVTRIKYLSGIGSNFEVTEAESALKEAQTNYYNALYDVIIAKIDLQTALGTLVQ